MNPLLKRQISCLLFLLPLCGYVNNVVNRSVNERMILIAGFSNNGSNQKEAIYKEQAADLSF
jgi:hypothetical protein